MRSKWLIVMCAFGLGIGFSVVAQERTPWVEPPLGTLSPMGATIEVENYRCTVTSQRTIQCMNIGRVCAEFRATEEKRNAKTFGCAIEGGKNYPCPPDDPVRFKATVDGMRACWPMLYGSP
jgi:hypothetical protein